MENASAQAPVEGTHEEKEEFGMMERHLDQDVLPDVKTTENELQDALGPR